MNDKLMSWTRIVRFEDIESNLNKPDSEKNEYYVIFKHSTRCGTSSIAKRMFEKKWNLNIPVFLVHVVEDRQLSNLIESKFGIRHESPQLLLINNNHCIYHASHSAIDVDDVTNLVLK